jgi:AraC-like DNA-binding protein
MISKDYPYLSGKLHREYDSRSLIEQREDIEKASKKKIRTAQFLILTSTLTIIFFVIRFHKDRKIKKQYVLLQKKIEEGSYGLPDTVEEPPQEYSLRKTFLTPELTIEIGEKLKKFERELQFTKKGITQNSIAAKLNTNANYLSIYINENKGMNFTRYIAELRIKYITNLLNTNTKYLNYTIEALAEECGIAARQNFSNLFYDINGIRPTDYIKKRKKELRID